LEEKVFRFMRSNSLGRLAYWEDYELPKRLPHSALKIHALNWQALRYIWNSSAKAHAHR